MKILSATQIHDLDSYTIGHEPIVSVDLMERAAFKFFNVVYPLINPHQAIFIFCGQGNNGGDGLVVARKLVEAGNRNVNTFIVRHSSKPSFDFLINEERLKKISSILYIETERRIPSLPENAVVIDAIFGSGLSKPVDGIAAKLIKAINKSGATVYSVDIPAGMFCDKPNTNKDVVIESDITFTFHAPKLSFLFPSSGKFVPHFEVIDIGFNRKYAEKPASAYSYVNKDFIQTFLKARDKFSHKGTYGHALICAGSYRKMGAAILATKAALKGGAGLVTSLIPKCGYEIMQISNPEAMVITAGDSMLNDVPDLNPFTAIAVGPGIGTSAEAVEFLHRLLKEFKKPMVIDADALNILSEKKALLKSIPPDSILTPHPGEFGRLAGEWKDDLDKLKKQIAFSKKYKVVIVLKGAHTSVSTPDGNIYFNSTGNPGMAKGGSGDALTGIIVSLLTRGQTSIQAAILGVYIHGFAGDLCAKEMGMEAMNASDIVGFLSKAFMQHK